MREIQLKIPQLDNHLTKQKILHILIVDDEPFNILAIKKTL